MSKNHPQKTPDDPLYPRAALWLGWGTLLILLAGFGTWSLTTTIAGAIVASGRVEVEQNRQIVQHPTGGVVEEIMTHEGANVAAGDILLRLDGHMLRTELAAQRGQLHEVQARRARLEAERDGAPQITPSAQLLAIAAREPETAEQLEGQRRLFEARAETLAHMQDQLEKRKAQTRAQIAGITAQSQALGQQLALIEQELADQQSLLEKGLAQASRVLALQREQARLAGEQGELTGATAQAEGRITEIELEVLRLQAQRREEASTQLRDISTSELQLFQQVAALEEQLSRLEIRAPVAGKVLGLQVTTPRAVLRAADPVAHIIPQDRPLIITAQISPLHIDEVQLDQPVKLMFPAFSARSTPELQGKITMVSADALTDQAQNTYYRAEISLNADEAARLGQTLLPGMPVDAFIQTGARSPMAYLLRPFTDYFSRAFRES